ncbi:MAG: type II toxin-antitoxin system RelE/ParE family toxin [Myxococcales bacterium]|nr:type II toxin-antitoxin system RelE/ParE family toxin [Myxococcales bacterium]
MSYRFSRRAALEIERTERWWRKNRPAAPDALVDEIAVAIDQVLSEPESGSPWGARQGKMVRRVLMPKTQRFLYYVFEDSTILVLSVRSAKRARGPRFTRRKP